LRLIFQILLYLYASTAFGQGSIYYNDFEDSTGTAWNTNGTYSFNGSHLLGPFGNQAVSLTLNNLPTNDSVEISFTLYIHDSWDGNSDKWKLSLKQSNIIQGSFITDFNNHTGTQSYPDPYPSNNPSKTGATQINLPRRCISATANSSWSSTKYIVSKKFASISTQGVISFESYQSSNACDESWGIDSVLIMPLNSTTISGVDTVIICKTPIITSYTWVDGNTYTTNNSSATHTYTDINGNDSIVKLNLIFIDTEISSSPYRCGINKTVDVWVDTSNFPLNSTISWYSRPPSSPLWSFIGNGDSTSFVTNYQNIIQVSIEYEGIICSREKTFNSNDIDTVVDSHTICDSFTWIDGNTYTASNNSAIHTLKNKSFCDSVVTLDLTVYYSNTGTDTITACDSYTWIDGNTYNTSNNTATHTLTNNDGCDSVVTLDLTVYYSYMFYTSDTSELVYNWESTGFNYYQSGTYYSNSNSKFGCDSVVVLELLILPPNTFYIANSFTPNNDGKNDFYFPVFINANKIEFNIYDRWGNLVFQTTDLNSQGWDGYLNNRKAPLSTYRWMVQINYINGETLNKEGLVNLLR